MKVKSMHYSKNGNAQAIAARLGEIYRCVSDQIPPAYPCESEKVIFIGIETEKKIEKPVVDFCKDLTPQRTKNVAFYLVSGSGNTSELFSHRKERGSELFISRLTLVLGLAFFAICLVSMFI